ncbi:hypothetical protein GCU60_04170 [Blastococcus saxobsidens]|uniref:Lipoprotein n=1 Tax=Blastococcus saxobsidens TaxID=138336 RepID=A0A6L9W0G9_9ACTN|nr:hypothetical protein [Blastococcus saxobsidens]NEK84960.1 hypothetical protein [Blastococcus saxobsidens]
MAVPERSLRSPAAAGLLLASTGVLAGCGQDDSTGAGADASVGDVQQEGSTEAYDGPYTTRFAAEVQSYDGKTVALSADVNRVLGPAAFSLAGTDDTTIQPLLVVAPDADTEVRTDHTVAVTGTVHLSFDLAAVEQETGTDLDDGLLERFDGKPYLTAGRVEASAPADR